MEVATQFIVTGRLDGSLSVTAVQVIATRFQNLKTFSRGQDIHAPDLSMSAVALFLFYRESELCDVSDKNKKEKNY